MEGKKHRHKRGDYRTEYGTGGFYFQQRRSKLDLRSLSKLDLSRIVKDVDLESLQSQLENIAFGQLNEEDLRFMTDQHIIKLFKVSQLTIEYLLYAQEQLTTSLHGLATKYADKKKTLLRKREEMNILNDSSKNLKKQLQLKKKGIETLEALIKENSNGKSVHAAVKEVNDSKENTPPIDANADVNAVHTVKYYITGPDGICVEMQSPSNMLVFDVISDIRGTFISKSHSEVFDSSDSDEILPIPAQLRLICRGKQLLPESSLKENHIVTGDSLVAVVDGYTRRNTHARRKERKPSSTSAREPMHPVMPVNAQYEKDNQVIMEMLQKQQQVIENLTNSIKTEQVLRKQLDTQLESLEKQYDEDAKLKGIEGRRIKSKRVSGVEAGDIESDDEDLLLSRQEITTKLARSKKKIVKLEHQVSEAEKYIHQFEYAVGKQNVDMDVLRKELYQSTKTNPPNNNPIIVQLNGLQNSVEGIKSTPVQLQPPPASPAVTVRAEKKKTPPQVVQMPQLKPKLDMRQETSAIPVASSMLPPPEPIQHPEPITPTPMPIHTAKPAQRVKRIEPIGTSLIAFYPSTNPDLKHRHINMNSSYGNDMGAECISLTLPNDLDFDSMVFELRSAIAEKLDMPLSKIALQLPNGQIITLAVDAKEPFTAPEAAAMTATGQLKLRIIQPLSDRQLDSLVNQYNTVHKRVNPSRRKDKPSSAQIMELLSDTDSDHPTGGSGVKANAVDAEELSNLSSMLYSREALEDTFRDISDKEGLTDEELLEQRRKLNKMTNKLSDDIYTDVTNYRSDIVSSVLDHVNCSDEKSDLDEEQEEEKDEYIHGTKTTKHTNIQVTRMLKHDADISQQNKMKRYEAKKHNIQQLLARAVEVREVLIDETDAVPESTSVAVPLPGINSGIAENQAESPLSPSDSLEPVIGATTTTEYNPNNPNDDSAVLLSSIPNSIPPHGSLDQQDGPSSMDESMQSFHIHSPQHVELHEEEDVTLHGTMNVPGIHANDTSIEDRYGEYRANGEESLINVNNCSDVVGGQDSFNATDNSIKSELITHGHGAVDPRDITDMTGESNNIHSFVNDSYDSNGTANGNINNINQSQDTDGTDGMYVSFNMRSTDPNPNLNNLGGTGNSVEPFDDSIQSSLQSGAVRRYLREEDGVVSFNNTNNTNTSGVSGVSQSSNESLLDTAELLKYAGIDLSKTIDSNVDADVDLDTTASSFTPSSLGGSIDSSNNTNIGNAEMTTPDMAEKRREQVLRKADNYEFKAAEYNERVEKSKQMSHWNDNRNSGIAASVRNEPQLQDGVVVSPMRNRNLSPGPSSLFSISSSTNLQDDDKSDENSYKSDEKGNDGEEGEESHGEGGEDESEVKYSVGKGIRGGGRGMHAHDVAQMDVSNINGVSTISNNLSHVGSTPDAYGTPTSHGMRNQNQKHYSTTPNHMEDNLTSPFALTPAAESPFNNLLPSSHNQRTPSGLMGSDGHAVNMNNLELSYSSDYDTSVASVGNINNGSNHVTSIQPHSTSPNSNHHHLHGGDSLALSESGDAFMDILEDSSNTTSSAFYNNSNTGSGSAVGTPRSKK